MTCIYEPGVGTENHPDTGSASIDMENNQGGAMDDSGEGEGGTMQRRGDGGEPKNAGLSVLFQESLLCIGACVSGRVGYVHDSARGSGICIIDQQLFSHPR